MCNPLNIQVDEVILHSQHQLSQVPIPKSGNAGTFDYFNGRIEAFSRASSALPARFRDLSAARAAICQGLLTGTTSFAAGSQQLAKALFGILHGNSSIAPGDLAVCRYRATLNESEGRYLAILKIDPTVGLRPIVRKDPGGHEYVTFDTAPEVFTTLGYRLQKCALIRNLDPRPADFDLLLLDRQARATAWPKVANFFMDRFLEADPVVDSRRSTELLYQGLIGGMSHLRAILTPTQKATLETQVHQLLGKKRVHVDVWLRAIDPAAAKILRKELSPTVLPVRRFEIDRDYLKLKKVGRWRRFLAKGTLKVAVPASLYSPAGAVAVKEIVPQGSGAPYYEVVIHTGTLTEVA